MGVTTADDLITVAEQDATEDMYRMVGLDENETLGAPLRASVQRRLPWLTLNLVTAFAAAATVSAFEGTLEQATMRRSSFRSLLGRAATPGCRR